MTQMEEVLVPGLRPVRDSDSQAIIALIGGIWSTYPGIVLDVDGEEPWMRAPARAYQASGGLLWVVGEPAVACVGLRPDDDVGELQAIELKSLYVHEDHRRQGLARRLVALVERTARERGAGVITLWSDTRFLGAHAFYRDLGYIRTDHERALHDRSSTVEWEFRKLLG